MAAGEAEKSAASPIVHEQAYISTSKSSSSSLAPRAAAAAHETSSLDMNCTRHDERDMRRLGHAQQLVRRFSFMRSTFFVCVALASWELAIFTINAGLLGGGRAGLVWSFVWCFVGFLPAFLSMCEMGSMAPIAGSQYHWVSEFGPEGWQRGLSYFAGWMSVLAWQAGNAEGILLTGQLIVAMVQVAHPSGEDGVGGYVPQPFHATLITIGICVLTFLVNYYGNKVIPRLQSALMIGHVVLFVVMIVLIAVRAPKATSHQVFADFEGLGGWKPGVLGVLAGQISAISGNTGVDTAGHIAEEVEDAGINMPRTMLAAFVINGAICIPAVIILCYGMPDLGVALADPTTFPAIYVLRQCMSPGWLIVFLALTTVILFAANVNYMVAVSRDLWAFARDKGTPFPTTLAHVSPTKHIPTYSIAASCVLAGLLSLLYIGSLTAYYAIVSLFLVAILSCYVLSIGSIFYRRLFYPQTLPRARFSLGSRHQALTINFCALVWSIWCFFWSFWPQTFPATVQSVNWAPALFGGVCLIAGGLFWVRARKVYWGPVALVAGRKGNEELEEDDDGEEDEDGKGQTVILGMGMDMGMGMGKSEGSGDVLTPQQLEAAKSR